MSVNRKNIYFVSDVHLGAPDKASSFRREKLLIKWLDAIKSDASDLFIMGDLFDFWFEYYTVVPKGYIRLLGKLAELADEGINLHIFKGNHDLWQNKYFTEEFNAEIYFYPIIRNFGNKIFYLAHGDGLGPGDLSYKFLKKIFTFPLNKWLFNWIHPDIGIRLAAFFSSRSRAQNNKTEIQFFDEREWMVIHARDILKTKHIDYFVFGHRHFPVEYSLTDQSVYVNLGDWITNFSYGVFDGEKFKLQKFSQNQ